MADQRLAQKLGLGTTFGSFAGRIQRTLREQEELNGIQAKAAEERRKLVFQAMSSIRKALQETSRISLGERFRFAMEVSDWEGWPRLELNLIDLQADLQPELALVVLAHDRNDSGTIQLSYRSGEPLGCIHLKDKEELQRLPLLLRKCVRSFLDAVALYVVNPRQAEQVDEIPDVKEQPDEISQKLSGENMFSDDEENPSAELVDIASEPTPVDI